MPPRLALCTEYSIHAHGGTEVLVRELLRGLAARMEIVLVSDDDSAALAATSLGKLIHAHFRWTPQERSKAGALALARFLKAQKVDLAHFHFGGNYGWNNRSWGRCPLLHTSDLGIPCMTTNHGVFALLDGYCAPWRPLWMKLALLPPAWLAKMQVLAHTRVEVAVSRHDLGNLLDWYRPFAERFTQLYHSQIHDADPPPDPAPRVPAILCVGTIGQRKGQGILARAFAQVAARHPDWKLILAGRKADTEITAQIESVRENSRLATRIEMIENLSDQAITGLMQTASIFAMPSLQEGLGLSLQEALWHGCPAVGSRVGGIPELIDHQQNGLLVAPGSEAELAAALEKLMTDEPFRQQLASAARNSILAKGMTSQAMIVRYLALYDAVLVPR